MKKLQLGTGFEKLENRHLMAGVVSAIEVSAIDTQSGVVSSEVFENFSSDHDNSPSSLQLKRAENRISAISVNLAEDDLTAAYDNSLAISDAIRTVHEAGGGVVNIPSGHYYVGVKIQLLSHVRLELQNDTHLEVNPAASPVGFGPTALFQIWSADEQGVRNVTIHGGMITGAGNSHLFDFKGETTQQLLGALDRQQIPSGLREQFRTNGWALSESAKILVEEAGSQWLITDQDTRQQFNAILDQGELSIEGLATGHGILISGIVENVNINDISIVNAAGDAILVSHDLRFTQIPEAVEIVNCNCNGNLRWGAAVVAGKDILISGGTYSGNLLGGIDVENEFDQPIQDLQILGVDASNNFGTGIRVQRGTYLVEGETPVPGARNTNYAIRKNRIVNNQGIGIFINSGDEFLIDNNEVSSNHGTAITISDSTQVQVRNNRIEDSANDGIHLNRVTGFHIGGNQIDNHPGDGIRVNATDSDDEFCIPSDRCTISQNNVSNTGFGGITVAAGTLDVSDNRVVRAQGAGISLGRFSPGSRITNNLISRVGTGIGSSSPQTQILDNIVTSVTGMGIFVDQYADQARIHANFLHGSRLDGIHIGCTDPSGTCDVSTSVELFNNVVARSGLRGVFLSDQARNSVVASNFVGQSGADGIRIEADLVRVNFNAVYDSGGHGIFVSTLSSAGYLWGNIVIQSLQNGIHIQCAAQGIEDWMLIRTNSLIDNGREEAVIEHCVKDIGDVKRTILDDLADGIRQLH